MRTRIQAVWLLPLVALAAFGCVEKNLEPSARDKARGAQMVRKSRPTPQHPLDIRFDDKVRLIGYDVDAKSVVLDHPFKVTWHWQVDKAPGQGFQVFTHIADAQKKTRMNLDAVRLIRQVHPVETWSPGEFIADEQEVTLPKDWASDAVVFFVGFYKGNVRMKVTQGPSDGQQRAEALRLAVKPGGGEAPLSRLIARYARTKITVDGVLDEQEWKAAQPTGPLVSTMNWERASFDAGVRVAYDASHLYLAFEVADEDLRSPFTKKDDHLWEQDCVEVMIDPDGDAKNYFELQVSPRGVSFDTRYDAPRSPRPFGHVDWDSQVRAQLTVRGTLDDDEDDEGYLVEMAIPWGAFAVGATPAAPPGDDSVWRMNFFVMNTEGKRQRAAGWSPPMIGDFHTLHRFGRVVFPVRADTALNSPTAPQR
jgi:Carbohydrate family 9 binding domain-like